MKAARTRHGSLSSQQIPGEKILTWKPCLWAVLFTAVDTWTLTLVATTIHLHRVGRGRPYHFSFSVHELLTLSITTGPFWSKVTLSVQALAPISLGGLTLRHATMMRQTLQTAKTAYDDYLMLLSAIRLHARPIQLWSAAASTLLKQHKASGRWITEEVVQRILADKPVAKELEILLRLSRDAAFLGQLGKAVDQAFFVRKNENLNVELVRRQNKAIVEAIQVWSSDLRAVVADLNSQYAQAEQAAYKEFFSQIEKSPLTDEQQQAVVCFDNRVLLVASAGSGKTSTMVAKAAYALQRDLFAPEHILMLAFNTKAALGLRDRLAERCAALNIQSDKVVVRTFHAFGLHVIGCATGKQPKLAPWLEQGGDIERIAEIVDALKRRDASFRKTWDLFRMVFDQPLGAKETTETGEQAALRNVGFLTLQGPVAASPEERVVADWLFYHGVACSNVTAGFAQYGFDLADVRSGKAFETLAAYFQQLDIPLDPHPARPAYGRRPLHPGQLLRLVRTFLIHVKSNGLTLSALQTASGHHRTISQFPYRQTLFLELLEPIQAEWERRLKAEGAIDYEDMLKQAVDHLESGHWVSPFELVMVDEFQDASSARARMARALVQQSGRFLFAVGDDWQSINRFAGADISVMTRFEAWFGAAHTLRLQRTFRCPLSLCTASSRFVLKNPAQIAKELESGQKEHPPTIRVILVLRQNLIVDAMTDYLMRLYQETLTLSTVLILGRYRKDNQFMSQKWQDQFGDRLDISFMTIHGAKGLEADYVILPRVVQGAYGFPSGNEDDELLALAMPASETYKFAEERRLFYVALTRARRSVALLTVENRVSEFVAELVGEQNIPVFNPVGQQLVTSKCPACREGILTPKTRKRDGAQFWGCSRYPKCQKTAKRC